MTLEFCLVFLADFSPLPLSQAQDGNQSILLSLWKIHVIM